MACSKCDESRAQNAAFCCQCGERLGRNSVEERLSVFFSLGSVRSSDVDELFDDLVALSLDIDRSSRAVSTVGAGDMLSADADDSCENSAVDDEDEDDYDDDEGLA